jgi:hypothetical protein
MDSNQLIDEISTTLAEQLGRHVEWTPHSYHTFAGRVLNILAAKTKTKNLILPLPKALPTKIVRRIIAKIKRLLALYGSEQDPEYYSVTEVAFEPSAKNVAFQSFSTILVCNMQTFLMAAQTYRDGMLLNGCVPSGV